MHTDHTGKGLLQLAEEFTAEAARLAAVNRMTDAELADALSAACLLAAPLPVAGIVCDDADAVDAARERPKTDDPDLLRMRQDPAYAEQRAAANGNPRNDATGGQDARGGRELLARLGQGDYEREVWG
jgi:hypothetical protein